jgi:membrane protein YdbS with pleckstrin-like domain
MPVMLHRRLFGEHVKDRVVGLGHVVSQIVVAAVALLVTGIATLIFSVVVSWSAGIAVAAFLVVALGVMLGVIPRRLEPR